MRRTTPLAIAIFLASALALLAITAGALPTPAPDSDLPSLQPPWECGYTSRVTQGHDGTTHAGYGKYAWDFSLPEGTPITAPAAGVVRKVRDDSTLYGCDPRYGWDANYVVIDLEDGHEVLLLHLQADSALVSVGDQVAPGDPIARVGNSGWTCGTHLHMQVQRTCNSWWCPSQKATLNGAVPQRGDHLRRQCRFRSSASTT